MKNLIRCLLLLFPLLLGAQKVDTIIDAGIYKSYFSYKIKQPVAVTYTLFHGGGEVSRSGMNFKNDTKIHTLDDEDYVGSGYDKGHMANAEDFAFNKVKERKTFMYYNCVPQAPELNRGPWAMQEAKARRLSQLDSILIICYNVYDTASKECMKIPTHCYRAVYSLTSGSILSVIGFENNKDHKEVAVSPAILKKIKTFKK